MSTSFPTGRFKWIESTEFDSNKYSSNSLKSCVLGFYLEYPEELLELHSDYPLAPDESEIKKERLSNYQLKVSDFLIFSLAMLKNWCLIFL